jgi:hypothetical protein
MMTDRNVFSLGSQIGGPVAPKAVQEQEQQLRDLMNRWSGDYTTAVREFAFLLRVDGEIHTYTKIFGIVGAQPAKRKRDWLEVEIGVPESWWREDQGKNYKKQMAAEISKGLHSMIELLKRNQHPIKAEALIADWERIKKVWLDPQSNGA